MTLIDHANRLGTHTAVAMAAHAGIHLERRSRNALELFPGLVRSVWGLASRREHDVLRERVSALEHRVSLIERTPSP